MALPIQELLLIAADLVFASVLCCVFYAVGCLLLPGLVGYVVVLSCSTGVMKKAKRILCQGKEAAMDSCAGRAFGKNLGLVGFRGTAPCPSEPEEGASDLSVEGLPAGERECQKAEKTLPGSRLPGAGRSCGVKTQSDPVWDEEREASEAEGPKAPAKWKKVPMIPAVLLSLLFSPLDWCLKKRHFQRLAALLTTLRKSRD